jgi:hypothetical protein
MTLSLCKWTALGICYCAGNLTTQHGSREDSLACLSPSIHIPVPLGKPSVLFHTAPHTPEAQLQAHLLGDPPVNSAQRQSSLLVSSWAASPGSVWPHPSPLAGPLGTESSVV